MRKIFIQVNAFIKGLIILIRPHYFLGWLIHPLKLSSNILQLTRWIAGQDKKNTFNDFYSPQRDYSKRYRLYQYVLDTFQLQTEPVDYLEFGVAGGDSFRWWVGKIQNVQSRFYGFDTFDGLPEDWGPFKRGDMAANVPIVEDTRIKFVKGLFQDTLLKFLKENNLNSGKRKIIHMDADLFSSTLFTLTCLAPLLHKGDIIFFDEFNVPNHEFLAFKIFSESYYIKTRLLGSVNNFLQAAFVIE